jgi:hypothetical protein
MATERQIAANRANALCSTGPKTAEGKAAVRFNAAKHCLLAEAALMPDENPDEVKSVRDALRDELQPQGELETLLVDRVASCFWRLRRAIKVEAGLFVREHYSEIARQANSYASELQRTERQDLWDRQDGKYVTDEEAYVEAIKRRDEANKIVNGENCALGGAFANDAAGANAFSKLSAYEARIERSLFKSLTELYQLQARRHASSGNGDSAIAAFDATTTPEAA